MPKSLRLLQTILGLLLGMSTWGCGGQPGAEYGMPSATYRLNGTVTSASSGEPIEGIAVEFGSMRTSTGKDGTWVIGGTGFPCNGTCTLAVKDVDGAEHGAFLDTTRPLNLVRVAQGDGRWNQGSFEQKDIQTPLERKP